MKLTKTAGGKTTLQITRREWEKIGRKKGWTKMARTTLSPELTERLTNMPESGMGYQVVDLTFHDDSVLKGCVVLNSSEVDLPEEYRLKAIKSVKMASAPSRT